MTNSVQPGDRPRLERPPSDRYRSTADAVPVVEPGLAQAVLGPVALVLGGAIAFVILGGLLGITAGLIIVATFLGWLSGRLVSPPGAAALVGVAVVVVGFVAIWLFGRTEGGVLDPLAYLDEVEGPIVVILSLLGGGALAAAASR